MSCIRVQRRDVPHLDGERKAMPKLCRSYAKQSRAMPGRAKRVIL